MSEKDIPLQQTAGNKVDEAFDPWEQVRPIPLFVIAVVFALALWGLMTYLSDHAAKKKAAERHVEAAAETGRHDVAFPADTQMEIADPELLNLVSVGKGAGWSCASCHGALGQGNLSTPRLAGQPAAYLMKQLQDFASGLRMNESMALVAKGLSEAEIDKVAHYYAQLQAPSARTAAIGGDVERGKALAERGDWKANVPACFSCHGMNGEGVAPGFPALAGQQADYLFAQLAAWHAGERKNSPQRLMDGIAQRMTPRDMRSVADYLGSLPAVPAGRQPLPPMLDAASRPAASQPNS